MGVSFNPKDQVKGGLLSDVDGTLKDVLIVNPFTYPNGGATACAVVAKLVLDDDKSEHDVFWSMGSPSQWEVSEDGMTADSSKGSTGTNDNSNFSFFVRELEPAGFPVHTIKDRIDFLEGLHGHWIQKATPARPGMENKNDRGQDRTCAVLEKYIPAGKGKAAAAGGKAAGKVSTSTPATAKAAPAAESNGAGDNSDFENENATPVAVDVIQTLKDANAGTSYTKQNWGIMHLSQASKHELWKTLAAGDKNAVRRLLLNKEFLSMQDVTVSDKGDVLIPA